MWNPLSKIAGQIASAAADQVASKLAEAPDEQKLYDMESLFLSGDEVSLTDSFAAYGGGAGESSAYSTSWVAYSCIRRQALDASGVPIIYLRDPDDPDDERNRLDLSHPTVELLEQPNPYFDRSEFVQWLVTMLLLRGEYFIVPDNPDRPTELIQYLDPLYWQERKAGHELMMWDYQHGGERVSVFREDVIHHRFIDPSRRFRGQSPLKSAAVANAIEVGGDQLRRNLLSRGGEKPILVKANQGASVSQTEKLKAALNARSGRAYDLGRTVVYSGNFEVQDPKFLSSDLQVLGSQGMSVDKVCAVYGMSKSLLGLEDIDKYATFEGRQRIYWMQQLVPLLHGIERSFDRFFAGDRTRPQDRCYVRFDLSRVKALQSNLAERFDLAGKAHANGVPWTVLNERFNLGLNTDDIPAAGSVFVSSTLMPADQLREYWSDGGGKADAEAKGDQVEASKQLSTATKRNAEIRRKARDPRRTIQRNIRLGRLEKQARTGWRNVMSRYKAMVTRASEGAAATASAQEQAIKDALRGLGRDLVEMLDPLHIRAAGEGMLAIQDLLPGKSVSGSDYDAFMKAPVLRGETIEAISHRQNRIRGMEDDIFDDLLGVVSRAFDDGESMQTLVGAIRSRMTMRVGRALTIARTEIGSAYSVARYVETKEQEFAHQMWLTAADELVRGGGDDEFDHQQCNEQVVKVVGGRFSCGLHYPMEDGGDAANVINCRCEAIPYESED